MQGHELLALLDSVFDKLSGDEQVLIRRVATYGYNPFISMMDYWKDNHSDADVRQRALEIVNEYPLM